MIRCFLALVVAFPAASYAQHQFSRGLLWEDNRYNGLPVRYSSLPNLPPSRSLRAFFPKVIVQPRQDLSGVAWSTVWNARTAAEAVACNQTDPAKVLEMAFSPTYNYGLIRRGRDCKEAISMIDLLESLVRNGTPYFSEYREFCPLEITADLFALARSKRLSGYVRLFNTTDARDIKVQSVKTAIASSNVVIAGMICPPSFQLATEFWQPREQPDAAYGGHALSIVGYDDTKFGGAFEVLNTWGKDWATQGFSWIRYQDFANFTPYAFSLFQVGSGACQAPFEGEVEFKLISGREMAAVMETVPGEYRLGQSYPTGTSFSISMSSNHPAYVYCFGVDPENTFFPLFPRSPATVPISFSRLKAPDDQPTITLTDPAGKNSIYLVFSPSPVDLNKCMDDLKRGQNVSAKNVEAVLSNQPGEAVKWNRDNIAFSGSLTAPVVVRVMLEQVK